MDSTLKPFPIKAYTKSQLAQLYENEYKYNTFIAYLNRTIKKCPEIFKKHNYDSQHHILKAEIVIAYCIHHTEPDGFFLDENDERVKRVRHIFEGKKK